MLDNDQNVVMGTYVSPMVSEQKKTEKRHSFLFVIILVGLLVIAGMVAACAYRGGRFVTFRYAGGTTTILTCEK